MPYSRVSSTTALIDEGNLTQLEFLALDSTFNFADGHARQELTASQEKIIGDLPELFAQAASQPVAELERTAFANYCRLLGQHSFPLDAGRVFTCYSSSVAMEIVARSLATRTDSIALIHPTFDNIPDILRGVGLRLVPLPEDELHRRDLDPRLLDDVESVFVTTPNNPTGRVLTADRLRRLAGQCAQRGTVLILDTSFRGFDSRAFFDHYAVLEASGCRWIVIEDTGKLWPTLDLKVGWLVTSADTGLPVADIYSDILLGVSPFVLALIGRFVEDAASGGLGELHRFIAGNRRLLRSALDGLPRISFPDQESRGSVERIDLGERSSSRLVLEELCERSVFVLPCRQFCWANPAEGDNAVRVALARPTESLATGAGVMREVLARQC
jgi:enduracididine biosynthesis enzyme MppP